MRHGSLFTGTGMLDYGLMLAGFGEPVWVAEWDEWRREHILAKRFPDAVRYGDVRHIGADCEPVECMAGGFPCKGASTVGKRNGFDHAETVLWREMARAIGELRPRYVVVENVANILAIHNGAVWGEVLGDLATLGYDVVWDCLPAAAVGAPHRRDRVFAVATYADGNPVREQPEPERGRSGEAIAGESGATPADAASPDGWRKGSQRRVENGWADAGGIRGGPATDAASGRRAAPEPEVQQPRVCDVSGAGADRRGVSVEWGSYAAAIRRWESRSGPAPQPLVRRVDDRSTARLERSRVSALGDGVQVQVGAIVGAYILEREASRMNTPASTRKQS